jgi:hypothetical protein
VDASHFTPALPYDEQPGRIVFTGLLSHPPNVDAAVSFAKTVLPLIRQSEPSAEFHIVGRHPAPEVVALTALPNVRLFPNVPDIRTHLKPASVVVVPLRYGSGSRQKILEAWSMEKCVVSTTVGAEGLAYEDGSNLFIADTVETMASAVVKALRDPALRGRVRHHGRAVAVSRHNPERLAAGYHAELTAVAREKAEADTRMRVLIDMRWMLPGLAGGIENLARAFMRTAGLDATNQYCALVPRVAGTTSISGARQRPDICQDSAWEIARAGTTCRQRLLASLRLPNVNTPRFANSRGWPNWCRDRLFIRRIHPSTAVAAAKRAGRPRHSARVLSRVLCAWCAAGTAPFVYRRGASSRPHLRDFGVHATNSDR